MGFENNFEKGPEEHFEQIACPDCQGTGHVENSKGEKVTCKRCKGTGIKPLGM